MKFCQECGSILMPNENDEVKCASCGYSESLSDEDKENEYTLKGQLNKENEIIMDDGEAAKTLAQMDITCYKCGGTKGYSWVVQTRSADEAPTFFIRCAKCGNTWRSSN